MVCPQLRSDDRLLATDRGLDPRSLAVFGGDLPFHPPIGVDRCDLMVSLREEIGFWPFQRIGAWRNAHLRTRAMLGNGLTGCVAVMAAIGRKLADGSSILSSSASTCGAGILVCHDAKDDFAAVGIQRQMQFPPSPTGLGTMFLFQPLASATDLQTGAIDEEMDRPFSFASCFRSQPHRRELLKSGQCTNAPASGFWGAGEQLPSFLCPHSRQSIFDAGAHA